MRPFATIERLQALCAAAATRMLDPDEVADVASSDALAARTATAEAEVDADGRMAQLLVATLVADEDVADEAVIDADA